MDQYPWGGSEELWSRTALRLCQDGLTVGANVWRWPRPARRIEELIAAGAHVKFRRTIRRLRRFIGDLADQSVTRWLDAFRPDLVVISVGYHVEGVEWMEACRRRSIPYALIIQSAGEYAWPFLDDVDRLAAGYEGAAACFFVSQGNIDFIRGQLAAAIPTATIVRNTFNVSYDAAPPWPEQNDLFPVACVGRLASMAKGQDLLFRALQADKWRKRPLRVTLFGDGPDCDTLQRLKALFQLENVAFAGHASDVEEIWSNHQMLVLPSRFEGLPLVVVEAMLCGRPCLVTDVQGNAELVEDEVTGFVAGGPTVRMIDEALERAWSRRADWRAMGAEAAGRVRQRVPRDPAGELAGKIRDLLGVGLPVSSATRGHR